ncbi:MAG: hypothetical protein ACMUJM_26095 [bacterium]
MCSLSQTLKQMYTIEDIISSYPNATSILKEFSDSLPLILKPEEINDVNSSKDGKQR